MLVGREGEAIPFGLSLALSVRPSGVVVDRSSAHSFATQSAASFQILATENS